MQNTSQSWKDEHKKNFLPPSFVEIRLKVGDPNAQADAMASDNGHEFYSKTELLTDELEKHPVKWASLEPGLWLLDGTYRVLGMEDTMPEPEETTYYGFIPDSEYETMLTADWQDFYCVNKRGTVIY